MGGREVREGENFGVALPPARLRSRLRAEGAALGAEGARTNKNLADLPSSYPPRKISQGLRYERPRRRRPETRRAVRPRTPQQLLQAGCGGLRRGSRLAA